MAKGGQSDGAGRKRGIPYRLARANIDKSEKTGAMPLDNMLAVMRNSKADSERRDAMAKSAVPYLHPRLATVEYRSEAFDLTKLTEDELEQRSKMKQRLEVLENGHSAG